MIRFLALGVALLLLATAAHWLIFVASVADHAFAVRRAVRASVLDQAVSELEVRAAVATSHVSDVFVDAPSPLLASVFYALEHPLEVASITALEFRVLAAKQTDLLPSPCSAMWFSARNGTSGSVCASLCRSTTGATFNCTNSCGNQWTSYGMTYNTSDVLFEVSEAASTSVEHLLDQLGVSMLHEESGVATGVIFDSSALELFPDLHSHYPAYVVSQAIHVGDSSLVAGVVCPAHDALHTAAKAACWADTREASDRDDQQLQSICDTSCEYAALLRLPRPLSAGGSVLAEVCSGNGAHRGVFSEPPGGVWHQLPAGAAVYAIRLVHNSGARTPSMREHCAASAAVCAMLSVAVVVSVASIVWFACACNLQRKELVKLCHYAQRLLSTDGSRPLAPSRGKGQSQEPHSQPERVLWSGLGHNDGNVADVFDVAELSSLSQRPSSVASPAAGLRIAAQLHGNLHQTATPVAVSGRHSVPLSALTNPLAVLASPLPRLFTPLHDSPARYSPARVVADAPLFLIRELQSIASKLRTLQESIADVMPFVPTTIVDRLTTADVEDRADCESLSSIATSDDTPPVEVHRPSSSMRLNSVRRPKIVPLPACVLRVRQVCAIVALNVRGFHSLVFNPTVSLAAAQGSLSLRSVSPMRSAVAVATMDSDTQQEEVESPAPHTHNTPSAPNTTLVSFHGVAQQYAEFCDVLQSVTSLHRGSIDFMNGDRVVVSFNASVDCALPGKSALNWAAQVKGLLFGNDQFASIECGVALGPCHVGLLGTEVSKRAALVGSTVSTAMELQRAVRRCAPQLRVFCLTSQLLAKELQHEMQFALVGSIQLPRSCDANVAAASAVQPSASVVVARQSVYSFLPNAISARLVDNDGIRRGGRHRISLHGRDEEWLYHVGRHEAGNPFVKANEAMLCIMHGNYTGAQALIAEHRHEEQQQQQQENENQLDKSAPKVIVDAEKEDLGFGPDLSADRGELCGDAGPELVRYYWRWIDELTTERTTPPPLL